MAAMLQTNLTPSIWFPATAAQRAAAEGRPSGFAAFGM